MAQNTLQFRWIVTLKEGLEALFRDAPNVVVAGHLMWYPVEGEMTTRIAPDVLVAFDRPKGYRDSYKQWEEAGIAPHVVFEVFSPLWRAREQIRTFEFYNDFGVEEYYLFAPDTMTLDGWQRVEGRLRPIAECHGWTSPRLGIRFDLTGDQLAVIRPDGEPFRSMVELARLRDRLALEHDAERPHAESERQRANAERLRADAERQRAARLAERLRKLGLDPGT
jgi:Uma2 family endonuclease